MTLIPLESAEQDTLYELTHKIITVHDDASAYATSDELVRLTKFRKALDAKYKSLKKPFDDGVKQLKAEFEKLLGPLETAEATRRQALLQYHQQARQQADEAYHRQQQIYTHTVQQAVREGRSIEDVPVPLPAALPVSECQTECGTVATRRVQDFTVTDPAKIPLYIMHHGERLELWTLHEANIRRVRREAGEGPSPIPGITFGYKDTLQVR